MILPVLLLHGLGGTHLFWEDVQPLLNGQVTAIDLPADPSVAQKALVVLSTLREPHLVIGHSLGGMVAQEMALAAPELIGALVLANTIPAATDRVVEVNTASATIVDVRGSAALTSLLVPQLFGTNELEGTVRARSRVSQDMSATPSQRLSGDLRAICRFDARDRLKACRVPALVLGGEHETNLADQQLLAKLLRTELVVVPHTGHMSPAEAPTVFVEVVGTFLDRIAGDH